MIVNLRYSIKVVSAVGLAMLTLAMSGCGPARTANEATETTADVEQASLANEAVEIKEATGTNPVPTAVADAATILARREVPVLCYHQVREWKPGDSQSAKDYICPTSVFTAQMQMLANSGYHSISPDQLYGYLATGANLPYKPVLISFDDGDLDQYETALPILKKHGFKATFFIMTVVIGRHGYQAYVNKDQIRDLVVQRQTVGCHTWDHHNVKKYSASDWTRQLTEPTKLLEDITGKPIRYFAYPFGLWNHQATVELKKQNYLLAFQLAEKPRDPENPLLSVRRIIASGYWKPQTLARNMTASFR